MKITTAKIKNFGVIGEAELRISDRGLMLIQGENADDTSATSNGSGKSTIPDAISWCIYGVTARGISGDDVVHNKVNKDCCVEISVDDNGLEYRIARYRKDKTHKNDLVLVRYESGSTYLDLTKGTAALTQLEINKIIGSSYEVFVASSYFGQEMMPDLPSMTDKQLKMIVEEASGTEVLQRAHDLATAKLKKVESDRATISTKITLIESAIAIESNSIANLQQKSKDLKISKARDIKSLLDWHSTLLLEIQCMPQPYDASTADGIKNTIQVTLDKIESATCEESAWLAELDRNLRGLEKTAHEAALEEKNDIALAKIAKGKLDSVNARVGTPCKECGKEYHEHDIEGAKVIAQENLNRELKSLSASKKALAIAEEQLRIAQDERKAFADSMTDISELLATHSAAVEDLRQSEERAWAVDTKQIERDNVLANIARLKAEVQQNPFERMIVEHQAQMTKLQTELSQVESLLEVATKAVEKAKAGVDVFGRAGARAHILDSVTPFLNEKTAEYLGTLTDGNITASWSTISTTASGEIREKFSITVSKNNGSKVYKGLSGGEKRKVRLATAMALQDLVASRATKPIEFQFLDEIDDSIDAAGLERLMTILQQKGREKGSVFVISHNDLNSYIANAIKVKNVGGISIVIDN